MSMINLNGILLHCKLEKKNNNHIKKVFTYPQKGSCHFRFLETENFVSTIKLIFLHHQIPINTLVHVN